MLAKSIRLLVILLFPSFLSASPIPLSELNSTPQQALSMLDRTEIAVVTPSLDDKNRQLPPPSRLFKSAEDSFIHLGYTPDILWIRFRLHNDTPSCKKAILRLSNQMLEHVTLYKKSSGGLWQTEKSGIMEKNSFEDGFLHPHFTVSMEPNSTELFYLRIASESCALYTDLSILEPKSFERTEVSWMMVMSLFFGAMGALILYNFFIFLFTRDSAYLYYVLYHLFATVNYLSYTCFTNYLLPPDLWKIDAFLGIFYIGSTALFLLLFFRTFLKTARYPRLDAGFKLLIAASFILILTGLTSRFNFFDIAILVGTSAMLYALFVSILLLLKGEHNARLLAIGWSAAAFGWISLALYDNGYSSPIYIFPYTYEAAMFIEAILFSVALAYKLSITDKLKRELRKNEFLLKELNHRVKNNMQFIISLYRLKLDHLRTPGLPETLKEIEGSIQAMSSAHEMLYKQDLANVIDLDEYIRTLVRYLQESFRADNIEFDLQINASAAGSEAIHIGTILNELIINALKYAFPNKNGTISIKLFEREGKKILVFKDNGIGCERAQERKGFGMELVDIIVKEELKGTIELSPEDGCSYTISWSSRQP